jgi:hypothetical protein
MEAHSVTFDIINGEEQNSEVLSRVSCIFNVETKVPSEP